MPQVIKYMNTQNIQKTIGKVNNDVVLSALGDVYGPDIEKCMEEMRQVALAERSYEQQVKFLRVYWELHYKLSEIKLMPKAEEENI